MSGATLITGGAGFVGTNLAARLVADGRRVIVLDDLSRPGVEQNLRWLVATSGERVEFVRADVRDAAAVAAAVARADAVYHLAAQVAVTTSLADPAADFAVNAGGTLNVLEAARACPVPPPVIYCSTNKVYGDLGQVEIETGDTRCAPVDRVLRTRGVSETQPLDLYSPYGCSKGAADQYVRDYARSFGLPTIVLRMSCIYGPHQFGTEDQGWVAHFLTCALAERPLTIYGDGKQVRDILHVDDLVEAFLLARAQIARLRGQVFNLGGGPDNSLSLREVLALSRRVLGRAPHVAHGPWRTGDQPWYVSDTSRFRRQTGWRPQVSAEAGIRALLAWLAEHRLAAAPAARAAEA